MSKAKWWNGRLVGAATLLGGAAALIAWAANDWFQEQVVHAWDAGWPQLQVALPLALLVFVGREIQWHHRLRTATADADAALRAQKTELSTTHEEERSKWDAERAELESRLAAPDPDALASDRALYTRLLELLPSDGATMWFVREHPFDVSYEDEKLNDLRAFLYEWDLADTRFHDLEVEAARAALHAADREFVMHLATHAFQRDDNDLYRIYPDVNLDWENGSNAYAIKAAQEASDLSWKLWEAHQSFVETGKRRLRL